MGIMGQKVGDRKSGDQMDLGPNASQPILLCKNLNFIGCATVCAKSEVILTNM